MRGKFTEKLLKMDEEAEISREVCKSLKKVTIFLLTDILINKRIKIQ